MKDDNFLAHDLESLKIAAREARQNRSQSQVSKNGKANRTDIVHAGYRFLQCIAAAIIFIYHVSVELAEKLPDLWDMTFIIVYPACFIASLILAIIRLMNFLPNPTPIIPVAISVLGWAAMLIGAVLAMRHANLNLHIEAMTDDEIASDPTFRHDLLLCSLSLVGSSVYLVHAWLCFDCWRWEKRMKKMGKDTNAESEASGSNSKSESDSGMSSEDETEPNNQTGNSPRSELPGTSDGRGKPVKSWYRKSSKRGSKLLKKLKKPVKMEPEETDTLKTLNEILRRSVAVKQIRVEDEPVKLYCCCVDLCHIIKQEYRTNVPVHEFQVVHVM